MTNLSTSSSDISRGPWYFRSKDIVATIATVGLLELALHIGVANFKLFEADAGITQRSSFVENAVNRAEKADAVDVAIVGSSIADGIDTDMLAAELGSGTTVESFRLVGADSYGTSRMLDTVVFPNLEVDWVVYVMSPHDTNGLSPVGRRNERIPSIEAYSDNRFTYKLSRVIEKNFYLYRYRTELKALVPTPGDIRKVIRRGQNKQGKKAAAKPYEFATYEAFEEAERFKADLEYVRQLCEQNGTKLVILALPTNPAAEVTKPEFKQDAAMWLADVKAFAEANDLGFVNGFEFIQAASQFRDTHHLSREGIVPTTQALGAAISSQ